MSLEKIELDLRNYQIIKSVVSNQMHYNYLFNLNYT